MPIEVTTNFAVPDTNATTVTADPPDLEDSNDFELVMGFLSFKTYGRTSVLVDIHTNPFLHLGQQAKVVIVAREACNKIAAAQGVIQAPYPASPLLTGASTTIPIEVAPDVIFQHPAGAGQKFMHFDCRTAIGSP